MAWLTVTFDANGGTLNSPATLYYGTTYNRWATQPSEASQYAVSSIAVPVRSGYVFTGFWTSPNSNGTPYADSSGALLATFANPSANFTVYAGWRNPRTITDFFDLASDALVPVASTGGDVRQRVAISHGGKYDSGVNETGGVLLNPSVTYAVIQDTTVSVELGKAWGATFTGTTAANKKMTVSGYMITAVEINTEAGAFPTVTVSAVANEGANAVNNFTENIGKFNVSVPVLARSRAQNLLGAISGGGALVRCSLLAAVDPVVLEEGLMPCASDIVNGRYELSAETVDPDGATPPTATAASGSNGGFTLIGDPQQRRDNAFLRYSIQARREMV